MTNCAGLRSTHAGSLFTPIPMPDNVRNPGDRSDRSNPDSPETEERHSSDIQNDPYADASSADRTSPEEHPDSQYSEGKHAGGKDSDGKYLDGEKPDGGKEATSDVSWEEVEAVLSEPIESSESLTELAESSASTSPSELTAPSDSTAKGGQSPLAPPAATTALPYGHPDITEPNYAAAPPLALVETAFLASTASLMWLISYYLSIGPWMRILFPIPIALVHLRWGNRAAWMSSIVSGLLLSVLMGPYLSILFLIPYGILGVQLGFLWQKKAGWGTSITIGTIVATISLFFRLWLLSTFLGEDLWIYLTGRITDLLEWAAGILVNWGILGVGMLGQPDLQVVQLATVGMVLFSDLIYLFTVQLAAWLLLERVGAPISTPPRWVQVLLDEAQ